MAGGLRSHGVHNLGEIRGFVEGTNDVGLRCLARPHLSEEPLHQVPVLGALLERRVQMLPSVARRVDGGERRKDATILVLKDVERVVMGILRHAQCLPRREGAQTLLPVLTREFVSPWS